VNDIVLIEIDVFTDRNQRGKMTVSRKDIIQQCIQRDKRCIMSRIYPDVKHGICDVDELAPRSEYPQGIYILENTQLLCRHECHYRKHHQEVEAAMIIGLYGPKRMRRYDYDFGERLGFFYRFIPGTKVVLEEAIKYLTHIWFLEIPGYYENKEEEGEGYGR